MISFDIQDNTTSEINVVAFNFESQIVQGKVRSNTMIDTSENNRGKKLVFSIGRYVKNKNNTLSFIEIDLKRQSISMND